MDKKPDDIGFKSFSLPLVPRAYPSLSNVLSGVPMPDYLQEESEPVKPELYRSLDDDWES
jgi:hypothetical protein